jgi:hypothetical protein
LEDGSNKESMAAATRKEKAIARAGKRRTKALDSVFIPQS